MNKLIFYGSTYYVAHDPSKLDEIRVLLDTSRTFRKILFQTRISLKGNTPVVKLLMKSMPM